jgi:hypothetical protein
VKDKDQISGKLFVRALETLANRHSEKEILVIDNSSNFNSKIDILGIDDCFPNRKVSCVF